MSRRKIAIRNLHKQLRSIGFDYDVDYEGMIHGDPQVFVRFYRHLLCNYNPVLTTELLQIDHNILDIPDETFMDVLRRIAREKLGYEVLLTNDQFYSFEFALEKIKMALIVAALTKNFLDELNDKQYPEKRGDDDEVDNCRKTLSRITDRIDNVESRLINIELGLSSIRHPIITHDENTVDSNQQHSDSTDVSGSRNIVTPANLFSAQVAGKLNFRWLFEHNR